MIAMVIPPTDIASAMCAPEPSSSAFRLIEFMGIPAVMAEVVESECSHGRVPAFVSPTVPPPAVGFPAVLRGRWGISFGGGDVHAASLFFLPRRVFTNDDESFASVRKGPPNA